MLAVLSVAVSLASAAPVTLDVPYLPQSALLCGGAAAAMVFRYWGDSHAGVQPFESLIDRRAGGIADDVLVRAIAERGWRIEQFTGSLELLDDYLARGEPIIVLLEERGNRYHYVVVVGRTASSVVVHDPARGPNRQIEATEFLKRWDASQRWALSVRPPPATESKFGLKADTTYEASAAGVSGFGRTNGGECDALVDRGIADVRERGLEAADDIFGPIRARCPHSAGPLHELAGIRFAQRRWRDAASLARQAIVVDANDEYALDVLGSSLFMLDYPVDALKAWNRISKPTLDRVLISGLHHARYQTIHESIGLTPGALLTADAFEQARRRLDELPDRATARLDVRPDADGFAVVDVVIAERSAVPVDAASWTQLGLEAAVNHEVTTTLPGFSGQGETWTASWRWWANRPRASLEFAAPLVGGLRGIWRVNTSWEAQTYSVADRARMIRETRTHADLSVVDWFSSSWRYVLRGGIDDWAGQRAAFVGGGLEHRLLRNRVSIRADVDSWFGGGSLPRFTATSVRARWSSRPVVHGWSAVAGGGIQHVGDGAPLALWSGAGDGRERGELLRAHPMLNDGVINVASDSVFGRSIAFGNAEARHWMDTPWPVRIGVAVFADVAHAGDRAFAAPTTQVDVGGGLRLRLPGSSHALRVDVAHGLRDGANALTIGWSY